MVMHFKTPRDLVMDRVRAICDEHKVKWDDVRSQSRRHVFIRPRFKICLFLREEMRWSYARIGRFMGGRDHSTILYAVRRERERRQ